MVARNEDKMRKAIDKIKEECGRDVKMDYVVADFGRSYGDMFFNVIFQQLKNKGILDNLAILVNNVGVSNMGYVH